MTFCKLNRKYCKHCTNCVTGAKKERKKINNVTVNIHQ